MRRSERKQNSACSQFLDYPFNGDRETWPDFEAEVLTVVSSKIGRFGIKYLETDWPTEDDLVVPGPEYDFMEEPELLLNGTQEAMRLNISTRTEVRVRNKNIEECIRACSELLSERVTKALNDVLLKHRGKPHSILYFWDFLKKNYGDNTMTSLGKGSIYFKTMATKMKSSLRFNEFILGFNRKMDEVGLVEALKLTHLLSDGNNELALQLLPKRLIEAVKICTLHKYDYKTSVDYIQREDDLQHSRGQILEDKETKNLRVLSTQNKLCSDCDNKWKCINECLCPQYTSYNKNTTFSKPNRPQNHPKREYEENQDVQYEYKHHQDKSNHAFRGGGRGFRGGRGDQGQRGGRGRGRQVSVRGGRNGGGRQFTGRGNNSGNNNDRKYQRIISSSHVDEDNYEEGFKNDDSFDQYGDDDVDFDDDDTEYYETSIKRARTIRRLPTNKLFLSPKLSDKYIKNISVIKSKSTEIIMLADSGAEEYCVRDMSTLNDKIVKYDDEHLPNVQLAGAGGELLPVTASGNINDVIKGAYVCEKLDVNILSTNKLRDEGYWFIQPPTFISPNNAGFFFNQDGKLALVCDENLLTDVKKMNLYDSMIELPDIQPLIAQSDTLKKSVSIIYGFTSEMSITDKVNFIANSFLLEQEDLCFLSLAMDEFPLTATQIRKYRKQIPCLIEAKMQAKSKHASKDTDTFTFKDNETSNSYRMLEQRNLKIGAEVGSDVFGPVLNQCASLFADKACGFVKSMFYKWSHRKQVTSKELLDAEDEKQDKEVAKSIQHAFDIYKTYGHSIVTLRTDSIKLYRSKYVQDIILSFHAKHICSEPGRHEHNGLAEVYIKTVSNLVTAMMCIAPHFPLQHWTKAWEYAELLVNMKKSRIPGSNLTRWEEFTHQRPNYKDIIFLPFGQAVEYLHPVQMRNGKFQMHSRKGMYAGPDLSHNGSIHIWNPKTLRWASMSTFKILMETPKDWITPDPHIFPSKIPGNNVSLDKLINLPVRSFNPVMESSTEDNHTLTVTDAVVIPEQVTSNIIPTVPICTVPTNDSIDSLKHVILDNIIDTTVATVPLLTENLSTTNDIPDIVDEILPSEIAIPTTELTIPTSVLEGDEGNRPVRSHQKPERFRVLSSEGGGNISTMSRDKIRKSNRRLLNKKKKRALNRVIISVDEDTITTNIEIMNKDYVVVRASIQRVQVFNRSEREATATVKKIVKSAKKLKQRAFDNPTMKTAMARHDWPLWEKAIKEEMDQMFDEKVFEESTYDYKNLPKNSNVVGSMFVLTIKRDKATGRIEKYKARLVALGNQQNSNSYDQVKSNTARGSSVKLLIALQAKLNAYSIVLDVKGAYLKSKIDEKKGEKLFIKLPNGNIVKLKKYIYGLKQAGREWQDNITSTLISNGYKSSADPLVFSKWIKDDFIIMSVHVDDFYVISSKPKLLDDLYNLLTNKYNDVTRKSGDLLTYLGMVVDRNTTTNQVTISQPAYIEKMLILAEMSECKGIDTPMAIDQTVNDEYSNVTVDKTNYLKLVGLINYLASYTRPDLLYSLSRVAQACSNPTKADLIRVKRIIRHIIATKDKGITYNCDNDFDLYCYVDASYNCYADGKGHYGYTFSIGKYNGSFYAKSSKIRVVALSSTESEYIALCHASTEIVYLRNLLSDIGFIQSKPTIVFEDNISCIKMAHNDLNHKTTKHINAKYHFTKSQIDNGNIKLKYKETYDMIADILTKPLNYKQHSYLSNLILNQ